MLLDPSLRQLRQRHLLLLQHKPWYFPSIDLIIELTLRLDLIKLIIFHQNPNNLLIKRQISLLEPDRLQQLFFISLMLLLQIFNLTQRILILLPQPFDLLSLALDLILHIIVLPLHHQEILVLLSILLS